MPSFGQRQPQLPSVLHRSNSSGWLGDPSQPTVERATEHATLAEVQRYTKAADKKPERAGRITFRDELAEVLAKHHVAIGVSVPEVVPDGTGNLAKCWSEWQDLLLVLLLIDFQRAFKHTDLVCVPSLCTQCNSRLYEAKANHRFAWAILQ